MKGGSGGVKLASGVNKPTKGAAPAPSEPKRVSLKNQLRSLKRLLSKTGVLGEEVRLAKEKQVAELEARINKVQKVEKLVAKRAKVKSVRFVERRKAERALAKAKLILAEPDLDDERRELTQRKLDQATQDIEYIKHFPLEMKYVSLYVKGERGDPKAEKKIAKARAMIAARKATEAEQPTHESDEEAQSGGEDAFLQSDDDDDDM